MVLNRSKDNISQREAGFTLAEMLIVVAVMVIVTSVVLANNNKFGGVVLLQNLAYDIALSTREAQVYSISVLNFNDNFSTAFGVYYDITDDVTSRKYTVFADVNGDGYYNAPGEYVRDTLITRGFKIGEICVTSSSGQTCSVDGSSNPPRKLNIVYNHPEPDAAIRSNIGGESTPTLYLEARVKVVSPRGDELCIYTDLNGQISVRSCS